ELEVGRLEFNRVEFNTVRFSLGVDGVDVLLAVTGGGDAQAVSAAGGQRRNLESAWNVCSHGETGKMHAGVAGPEDERGGGVGDWFALALGPRGDRHCGSQAQIERAGVLFNLLRH